MQVQVSEHLVEGVVVKINKAGPRPEYEQLTHEQKQCPQQVCAQNIVQRISDCFTESPACLCQMRVLPIATRDV